MNRTEHIRILARNRWHIPTGQFNNERDYLQSCGQGIGNHKGLAVPRPEGKRVTGIKRELCKEGRLIEVLALS